ncbi:hypothetical protein MITS9504_02832 [Synechococcus sp. MIT S9504]|nr:hypothetical protein MITS9504_02832 [Synechococcus sp. MIT S9504]
MQTQSRIFRYLFHMKRNIMENLLHVALLSSAAKTFKVFFNSITHTSSDFANIGSIETAKFWLSTTPSSSRLLGHVAVRYNHLPATKTEL